MREEVKGHGEIAYRHYWAFDIEEIVLKQHRSTSLLLCIRTGQQQISHWVPESGTILLYSQDDWMAVHLVSPNTTDVRCTKYDPV